MALAVLSNLAGCADIENMVQGKQAQYADCDNANELNANLKTASEKRIYSLPDTHQVCQR